MSSAVSIHRSRSGGSGLPVAIADASRAPFSPPALVPATMSTTTSTRSSSHSARHRRSASPSGSSGTGSRCPGEHRRGAEIDLVHHAAHPHGERDPTLDDQGQPDLLAAPPVGLGDLCDHDCAPPHLQPAQYRQRGEDLTAGIRTQGYSLRRDRRRRRENRARAASAPLAAIRASDRRLCTYVGIAAREAWTVPVS